MTSTEATRKRLLAQAPIPDAVKPYLLPADNAPVKMIGTYLVPPHDGPPKLMDNPIFLPGPPLPIDKEAVAALAMYLLKVPMPQRDYVDALAENAVAQPAVSTLVYPIILDPTAPSQPPQMLPLWVLSYWVRAHDIVEAQRDWDRAKRFVSDAGLSESLVEGIPWNSQLPNKLGPATLLRSFCSHDWLGYDHIDLMLATIQSEIEHYPTVVACPTSIINKVSKIYRHERETYPTAKHHGYAAQCLQRDGDHPVKKLASAVSVKLTAREVILAGKDDILGNHWISFVIDVDAREIAYFDSMGCRPPSDLCDILHWWLGAHGMTGFKDKTRKTACTQQTDTTSCGLLSINALEHNIAADTYPLIDPSACDAGRLQMLHRVLRFLHKLDPEYSQPVPLTMPSEARTSTTTTATLGKRIRAETSPTSQSPDTALPLDPALQVAALPDASDEWEDEASDVDDGAGAELRTRSELIDKAPKKRNNKKGGRKPDPLLDLLTRRCYRSDDPKERDLYRCVGSKDKWCGCVYSSRNRKRWLKHAISCTRLPKELRDRARVESARCAPSVQVQLAADKLKETEDARNGPSEAKTQKTSGSSAVGSSKLHETAVKHGRKLRHARLHEAILLFTCVAGLSPRVVKLAQWKRIWEIADISYKPATRDELEDQITAQAAHVHDLVLETLRQRDYLTISWDGGTANNNSREAFWTVHISTERGEVFLMDVREATNVRHTATWIKDYVLEIMDEVGRDKFVVGTCDNTGNTRGSRGFLEIDVLTLLALADVCHHLGNTSKDIIKLPYFKMVVQGIRDIISKFHRSHPAIHAFERERAAYRITRGLVSVSKTRFNALTYSALSVQRCTPAIKAVVRSNVVDCEEFEEYFSSDVHWTAMQFHKILDDLIALTLPAAKALTCLEAVSATAADVYIFWHALLHQTKDALTDKKRGIPDDVQRQVLGILNHRYNQLFGERGSLYSPIYEVAAYLTPEYLRNGLFREDRTRTPGADSDAFAGIRYPKLYQKAAVFLADIAKNEIMHGKRPQFTLWKGRATAMKATLISEVKAYSRNQYPYNAPFSQEAGASAWWQALAGQPGGTLLPYIAIKIFAARVNSMPDERTVSTFTWLSSAVRNRIKVNTLTAMTSIRQYYLKKEENAKKRAAANPRPTVKFYDIKKLFDPVEDDNEDDEDDEGGSGSSWLDEPAEEVLPNAPFYDDVASVDFTSPYISEALADEATDGQGDKHPEAAKGSPEGVSDSIGEDDDENFDVLASDFV
ncbi:ribonuclease H-like domain-containing protein [Schizophyllum commune]